MDGCKYIATVIVCYLLLLAADDDDDVAQLFTHKESACERR